MLVLSISWSETLSSDWVLSWCNLKLSDLKETNSDISMEVCQGSYDRLTTSRPLNSPTSQKTYMRVVTLYALWEACHRPDHQPVIRAFHRPDHQPELFDEGLPPGGVHHVLIRLDVGVCRESEQSHHFLQNWHRTKSNIQSSSYTIGWPTCIVFQASFRQS